MEQDVREEYNLFHCSIVVQSVPTEHARTPKLFTLAHH